jgi:hypothetical protein
MTIRVEVDLLSVRLRQAQTEYDWAHSRGDLEHASRARVRIQAILAERDRYTHRAAQLSAAIKTLVV